MSDDKKNANVRLGGNYYANEQPAPGQTVRHSVGAQPPAGAMLDPDRQKQIEKDHLANKQLIQAFEYFGRIFGDRTLKGNKKEIHIQSEKDAIKSFCISSDSCRPSESIALVLRVLLALRDRTNSLEAENTLLAQEIKKLQEASVEVPDEVEQKDGKRLL